MYSAFDSSSWLAVAAADGPVLAETARKVLEARYLKKSEAGECIETPEELFKRVAAKSGDIEFEHKPPISPILRRAAETRGNL